MSTTKYLGPSGKDSVYIRSQLDSTQLPIITQDDVDTAITSSLSGKASLTYIDNTLSKKAKTEELTSYTNGKLLKSTIDTAGGPGSLSGGKILTSQIPTLTGGKPWKFLGTCPSWTTKVSHTSETQVCSWSLTNIGYSYYPLFLGFCELGDGTYGGELKIRQGGISGPIIARAVSSNSAYYDGCVVVPVWSMSPITSGSFSITIAPKFSGQTAIRGSRYSISCFAIPA